MDIIKRLAGMMKPYRKRVALALFLQLLVILSRLLAPFITRDIVNNVIPSQNLTLLLPLCAELLALVIMRASSTYARSVMLERVSQNVTYDLRTGLYGHLQELPYVFYDTHRIGEIMSRMTGDIEGVRNLIAGGLITVYDNALNFIGALIFLTFMSWQLMLSLLIFAPLIALTAWQFNKRIRPAFRNIREQNAALNTRTQENISGVRVVKAFTREDYESQQFDKDNTKLLNLNLEATRIWSIFVPLMELMSSLCTPIMLLVGGILLVNGQMDIGTLVAVNGYVWLIINPMRALSGIITVYDNALNFIGALIFLTFMSWQLMLALLIFAPLIALTAWAFNKRIRPAFRNIREQNAALNTRTQENISGVRVVKAFTREDYESDQFSKDNLKLLDLNLEATRIWSIFVPLMELMSSLCTPIMLLVGGLLLVNGQMDIGTLVAVNGYVWLIINPMRALSGIINMVAQAVTSAEKLFYYQDFGSVIREKDDARVPAKFEGHVEFDHVTFSYGGEDILTDITFEAKPGQTVAVMGATGAGKSTLVSLIGRFYDVKAGSVRVDGIDVRDQKLKPLRSHLGYVMQETFLFSDTLTDNIRFGRPDAEQSRVERAAQVAQAREFIEHMPQGYETVVGERGMGLSGGQKQRVAIARAVLVDPSILILDDSTSAVDMETEYLIQQELKDVLKNRTTFVIAHRISSVKNADLILVLDGGRVAERGTHQQLLEKKGIYYRMVQDQYRDFDQFARRKAGEA